MHSQVQPYIFFGHQMSVLVAFYISANQNLFLLCKWRTLLRHVTHVLKKLSDSIITSYTENHRNSLVLHVSHSCPSFKIIINWKRQDIWSKITIKRTYMEHTINLEVGHLENYFKKDLNPNLSSNFSYHYQVISGHCGR